MKEPKQLNQCKNYVLNIVLHQSIQMVNQKYLDLPNRMFVKLKQRPFHNPLMMQFILLKNTLSEHFFYTHSKNDCSFFLKLLELDTNSFPLCMNNVMQYWRNIRILCSTWLDIISSHHKTKRGKMREKHHVYNNIWK